MNFFDHLEARGWLKRIHSEFSEEEIQQIRRMYFRAGVTKDFKPRTHTMICVRARNLAESVFVLGGSKEECRLALKYLLVCLDCEKYCLDWRKFKDDYRIQNLEKKYYILSIF